MRPISIFLIVLCACLVCNAQWRATKGPGGSSIRALVSNGSVLYAGTAENGVFVSSDDGATWTAINNGLTNFQINALELSGDALYAATEKAGIFKSLNGGQNWFPINNGISRGNAQAIRGSGQFLIAGTLGIVNGAESGRLFRSTNGGQSWQEVLIEGSPRAVYSISKTGSEFFIGGFGWGYVSNDLGISWKSLNLTSHVFSSWVTKVERIGGTLFASALWAGMYRSDDNGVTWQRLDEQLPDPTVNDFIYVDEFLYVATRVGIYRKRLSESAWRWMPGGLRDSDMFTIAAHNRKVFTGGIGGAVYVNDNPKSFFVVTSSASYVVNQVCAGAIASIFGVELATQTVTARTIPLPQSLAGVSVRISSANNSFQAPLFFVSPNQINFQIPETFPQVGPVSIEVVSQTGERKYSLVYLYGHSPGLFAANADGRDAPAGLLLRIKANNQSVYEPIADWDATKQRYVARSIEIGSAPERDFLVLYGTGIRNANTRSGYFGNQRVAISFAGAAPGFVGLDQVNIAIDTQLKGRGPVTVKVETDNFATNTQSTSNTLTVVFK